MAESEITPIPEDDEEIEVVAHSEEEDPALSDCNGFTCNVNSAE
jgi:hypothetical protein